MSLRFFNHVRCFRRGYVIKYYHDHSFRISTNTKNYCVIFDDFPFSVTLTKNHLRFFSNENRNDSVTVDNKELSRKTKESNENVKKLKKILFHLVAFFEELFHMDEVIKAQARVLQIKDNLKDSGDRKREILFELNSINDEIKRTHDEIFHSSRHSTKFVSLLQEEKELLKAEKTKRTEFAQADEIERRNFTTLTNAINDSYEKEKVYSNTLRNLGIIGTLLGSLISFIGASLGFYLHNKKTGLILQNVNDIVNESIKREIGLLREDLKIDELRRTMQKLEMEQKKIANMIKESKTQEGWTGYFKRHSIGIYRWFYPVKQS